MQAYTYMSDEAIEAITDTLPHKYSMELNRSDMRDLLAALQDAYGEGNDWAGDFVSAIASTLDIEFVSPSEGNSMAKYDVLDLRELADEWQERIDEMSSSVPSTEGLSYGEVASATTAFLAQPEQVAYVAAYTELCDGLGIEHTPDDLRSYGDDYEPTLIAESYFQEYAQELAEDVFPYPSDSPEAKVLEAWPYRCIDWEWAARELKFDYSLVTFDGVDYYIRSV